jgi:hypothetical protein
MHLEPYLCDTQFLNTSPTICYFHVRAHLALRASLVIAGFTWHLSTGCRVKIIFTPKCSVFHKLYENVYVDYVWTTF